VTTASTGSAGQTPPGTAHRAKELFDVYTKGLKASDPQLLFTRDTREAYEFFSRGIDRTGIDQQPWHLRALTYAKLFFVAFTMRLSPVHRAIYVVALISTIIGLIKLFAGFQLVTLVQVNDFRLALPIPTWQDSIIFLSIGFVLLNLLIVLEVADRLSLKHDLTVARDIQRAMLPQGTFRAPGIEVHGETRPANTVGGDFFDMIPLADGRVIVALGDVAGKGSPAALLMALLLAMLRTLVDEGLAPGPLLERLNVQLLRHAPRSRFVTIFFAVLDPDGHMQWVNAGQNPPRIRRADGRIDELHATGVALGLFEGTTYATSEQSLASGDMLVAYSDGITEAENPAGTPFEEEGLDAVIGAWSAGSAPEITQAVQRAVLAHVGDARVGDDLTVLVLRRL
jgi:sigma-B regulation protein RsbU (phosphoserine phosphatase)